MKNKKPTLQDVGNDLYETKKKMDDYFAEQERLKKRPWWKKILGLK